MQIEKKCFKETSEWKTEIQQILIFANYITVLKNIISHWLIVKGINTKLRNAKN